MALIKCKECATQVYVEADKCPHCGVPNPGVSYEKEKEIREKKAVEDQLVNEIVWLGAQKKDAYLRLDKLETQLFGNSSLMSILQAFFPSADRKAKLEEFQNMQREIYALRGRMDELWKQVPSERLSEIDHLWNIENTTSLSQLRGGKK